ncbi:hypothetical protein CAPTEDRAFT_226293 [Capitella teleta]|uniref:Sphingomyelin phosphodiesterase 4 n=1 Tax=Capitella teleta TaxID=283909 RepID=R7TRQ2_CAPTE|nr:hypothetical protein CAPTEDRAFT_226293 [Capitella teleta]|eukprot:ELT96603.1 hypothetical protein CAPTEDRAFT_226293 [Capitella teleta]
MIPTTGRRTAAKSSLCRIDSTEDLILRPKKFSSICNEIFNEIFRQVVPAPKLSKFEVLADKMPPTSPLGPMACLHTALSKPLPQRCAEIKAILDDVSAKDLHPLIPVLIENIFGSGCQSGWGLGRISRSNSYEFQAVRDLLSSNGALLKLLLKFSSDPFFHYEYATSCLPFAHFLVNAQNLKQSSWVSPNDALFPILLEDYLNFFLPLDAPVSTTAPSPQKVATLTSPSSFRVNARSGDFLRPPAMSSRVDNVPSPETWKSQMFLQILIEFWLSQPSTEDGLVHSSPAQECSLPGLDHVRVVRMLVKHVHYFANSARSEALHSPYSSPVSSPWDDFKRQIIPFFMQKKIYAFLKHSFEKWPLDASFRQILETWLSYIQPWRYTDPQVSIKERSEESKDKNLEEKWMRFIMDNLLFFTHLLQRFIYRVIRMDLSSPRNAYMIFRVAKVYNVNGLRNMIIEAEDVQHESFHFAEWEGPRFQYMRLFDRECLSLVENVLRAISEAKLSTSSQQKSGDAANSSWASLFGLGPPQDYNTSHYYSSEYDEIGVGDIRKMETHLDEAARNLSSFFHLQMVDRAEKSVRWGDAVNPHDSDVNDLSPDTYVTEEGSKLSPLGRYQMMNGLRKFEVGYSGDPELQPIRSYESAIMVRMLYDLSKFINAQCGVRFKEVYNQSGVSGAISRRLLHAPTQHSAITLQDSEQPYLSLRWMASYQNIGFAAFFFLLLNMFFGIGPFGFILFAFSLVFFFAILQGFLSPKRQKTDKKSL